MLLLRRKVMRFLHLRSAFAQNICIIGRIQKMEIKACKFNSNNEETGTLVVFATSKKELGSAAGVEKEVALLLAEAGSDKAFTGANKTSLFFRNAYIGGFKHLLAIGLGESKKVTSETLREAGAVAYKALKSNKALNSTFHVDSATAPIKSASDALQALIEGLSLADYSYDTTLSKKSDSLKLIQMGYGKSLTLAKVKAAIETAEILAEGVNLTRWLGDSPGNFMTPAILAKETQKAAKGTKLKVTVWDKAQIKKEKMGGILGVNAGSDNEPRFIIMEYKGAAASKKPLCLVGKGLTFDSGGISLKPGAGMHEMKYDMQGGAAVIGAMTAIAKLKLKVNVVAYVPSTENMPNGSACKPGDVLTARNGKTVEVLNTDAEGRLILMDAIAYAAEKKPAAIVDTATLTGAIIMALGNSFTGLFSTDEKLSKKIKSAGEATGEKIWELPIISDHHDDMKGLHADLSNLSGFRGAGSSTAAAFLSNFAEDIPWAHLDIAGTGWGCANRLGYVPQKGATGCMVRTFVELAKKF